MTFSALRVAFCRTVSLPATICKSPIHSACTARIHTTTLAAFPKGSKAGKVSLKEQFHNLKILYKENGEIAILKVDVEFNRVHIAALSLLVKPIADEVDLISLYRKSKHFEQDNGWSLSGRSNESAEPQAKAMHLTISCRETGEISILRHEMDAEETFRYNRHVRKLGSGQTESYADISAFHSILM